MFVPVCRGLWRRTFREHVASLNLLSLCC